MQGHAQNRGRQLKISNHVLFHHITGTHPVPGCWLIPPHHKDLQAICVLSRVSAPSLLGPGLISAHTVLVQMSEGGKMAL